MEKIESKLNDIDTKLDKMDLALRRLIILNQIQWEKKDAKKSKEYLDRLESIAQDFIMVKKSQQLIKSEEDELQEKNSLQIKEWQETIKFVCPSKFLDDRGQLECELNGKKCIFLECPKK